MQGREGKIYVCKRYAVEWDMWLWIATCWKGDRWFCYEGNNLPGIVDFALDKAQELSATV